MIVADTNLVAYLLIEGERTEAARRVRIRDADWRIPTLWRAEFLNVLATSVRAGVLTPAQARAAWYAATDVLRGAEVEPSGATVLDAAIARGISACDAQFVVVAETLNARLVSGDRALARACPDRVVLMEAFAAP